MDQQHFQTQEKLLIAQQGADLDIALYLDPHLLSRLHNDNPIEFLHDGNLNDLWIVLEGVSHFLYLTWNAGFNRPVSQLELELQAEVDKYIITASLIEQQKQVYCLPYLHTALFEDTSFDETLSNEELRRYIEANSYASKYCSTLEKRYFHKDDNSLINELRRFYRLSQQAKIKHIRHLLH